MTTTETKEITNDQDVIDLRDVTDRVEHLEQLRQPGPVDLGDDNDTDQDTLFAELAALEGLLDELRGNGGDHDWRGDWYPLLMVRDSYFEDFARQEAEDLDLIKSDASWPYTCIDWEQAAEELKQDYSTVEFGDVTYWYRQASVPALSSEEIKEKTVSETATKQQIEHTPTPWHSVATETRFEIVDNEGFPILRINGGMIPTKIDAGFIVRAVNSHEALVAALDGLFEHCTMVHKHWGDGDNRREADAAIAAARDALAAAVTPGINTHAGR